MFTFAHMGKNGKEVVADLMKRCSSLTFIDQNP
jgi:hypothetical protein